jgi:hypothetical protein
MFAEPIIILKFVARENIRGLYATVRGAPGVREAQFGHHCFFILDIVEHMQGEAQFLVPVFNCCVESLIQITRASAQN